ncbi:hypothetical protein AVEN_66569-1 [Araneus ventricosus]|uniref:RNase H type-1 domain-containing protein n=1 Tax=Araneus ventricosus TaxID=182803 RepID=A0A4Y2EJJ8_ARAVE|nr:hypothetical protein AVEN_66569-1 [Araneus ventricosus]
MSQASMFPDAIEVGIIVLFHRKGKPKSETKSYRPVSLLPTLGKILEKLLLERLNFHLRANNLQAANQYGFTVNKSSEETIVDFIDEIEMARSTKQHALVISLDIKVIERILLYGAPAWANNITSRQQRLLNYIQRKFLLNITGAYSTTPTAALQVIEGITPLQIKAQMESILVRVGRLRSDCNWEGSSFLYQDFQQPNPPLIIHRAIFDLEDRVSIVSDPHTPAEAIYTDGSHLEGETGCAFCVIQNNVQIQQWTAKLNPHNTVFQAETVAITEAINWANSKGISTSIWSDSESALRAISSYKSSNPLIQETQQALLHNLSMQLNWIKAHIGFLGNEAADNLVKQATKEGTHLHLQARNVI